MLKTILNGVQHIIGVTKIEIKCGEFNELYMEKNFLDMDADPGSVLGTSRREFHDVFWQLSDPIDSFFFNTSCSLSIYIYTETKCLRSNDRCNINGEIKEVEGS